MKEEDIRLDDFHRIFVGKAPWEFLIEITVRTLIVYVLFYFIMKWLGKRMNGMLTVTEMVLMLMLGGIIAVPMHSPDKGLLQGFLVIACAFLFQKWISVWGFYSAKMEKVIQGRAKMLVKDGVILVSEMEKAKVSRYQLFSKLRAKEIDQLGKVKRVYLEASGLFSIYENKKHQHGLSTLPEDDLDILKMQKKAQGVVACKTCGFTKKSEQPEESPCECCKNREWVEAVE